MTPQQLVLSIREQIHTFSSEITDNIIYMYMNSYYQSFWEKVTTIDRNYWRDRRVINLNSNQIRYPLLNATNATSTTIWIHWQLKIERVLVKYNDTDQDHIVCREVDFGNMKRSIERYKDNQPKSDPIYCVVSNDIYVLPWSTDTIIDWLQLEWVKRPYELNTFTTSANDILLRPEYHDLIMWWSIAYIARYLRNENLAREYESYVAWEERKMLSNISLRTTKPVQGNIPNYGDNMSYRGF
jgi:hypothetical protein